MGRTVGPGDERLVYSIAGLLKVHKGNRDTVADLMKAAFTESAEKGTLAPVFVDDELNDESARLERPEPDSPDLGPVVLPDDEDDDPSPIAVPFPGVEMPALRW